jgi:hypothetical protein
MIFKKKKMVWCDDPTEVRLISIFPGCLANHDRAHSLSYGDVHCETYIVSITGTTETPTSSNSLIPSFFPDPPDTLVEKTDVVKFFGLTLDEESNHW